MIYLIRVLLMFVVASPSLADIWQLHDGDGTTPQGKFSKQAGVTCEYFNAAGNLPWRNPGGDWIDANGIAQGNKPFSSAPFARSVLVPQIVEIDVKKLLAADGIALRKDSYGSIAVASRESLTPPILRLTLLDGTRIERNPIADASLSFLGSGKCQFTPSGKLQSLYLQKNTAVMAFGRLPDNIVRATLVLTVTSSYGNGTLNAFAMAAPRTSVGTAETLPISVSPNPGVYYHESWESDDWWTRNGDTKRPDYLWTQDLGRFHRVHSGLWFADGSSTPVPAQGTDGRIQLKRGSGFKGRGLMISYHPTALAAGVSAPSVYLPNVIDDRSRSDPDEAWLTYYVKYGKDFFGFTGCEGGKAPGLSSVTTACGNSGSRANGLCGWSLRLSYKLICDPTSPVFGYIRLYMYAYHGLMAGFYGDGWYGNGEALLELGRWYCIEEHVKVNTPGVADGIAQLYVNGKVAVDRRDVYLRAVKPAQGYGVWNLITATRPAPRYAKVVTDNFGRSYWWSGRSIDSDLGIHQAWMVVHNGGRRAPGKVAQMWIDEIKVSHRRVGCL